MTAPDHYADLNGIVKPVATPFTRATPAPDATAIREAALREAAAVATNLKGIGWDDYPPTHPYDRGYIRACEIIAKRILALLTEKPHDRT